MSSFTLSYVKNYIVELTKKYTLNNGKIHICLFTTTKDGLYNYAVEVCSSDKIHAEKALARKYAAKIATYVRKLNSNSEKYTVRLTVRKQLSLKVAEASTAYYITSDTVYGRTIVVTGYEYRSELQRSVAFF